MALANLIECIESGECDALVTLLSDVKPVELEDSEFELFERLLYAAKKRCADELAESIAIFARRFLSAKERVLCILSCFRNFKETHVLILFTRLIVDCLDSLNESAKQDIFDEFVPYVVEVCRQTALNNETPDAMFARLASHLHELICKSGQREVNRQVVLILMKRSFESEPISRIAIDCLSSLESDPKGHISLPCDPKDVAILLSMYICANNDQFCSWWWPVYSVEYMLRLFVHSFTDLLKDSSFEYHFIGNLIAPLDYLISANLPLSISRDELNSYMLTFEVLLSCITRQELRDVQIRSTRVFQNFFTRFEPTAQCLIIRRLFAKILDESIKVPFEPQVLALLTDIYRRNMTLNSPTFGVFVTDLPHFYGQCIDALYEDVEQGAYFYNSFLLLIRFHAAQKLHPSLLCSVQANLLSKIRDRITDFLRLKELESNRRPTLPGMDIQLNLLQHNFKEAETKVKEALARK